MRELNKKTILQLIVIVVNTFLVFALASKVSATETRLIPERILPKDIEPLPTPIVKPSVKCVVAGCSRELCVDPLKSPTESICVHKEEYACFAHAKCEVQSNGACGWTKTDEYNACISVKPKPQISIIPTPTPTKPGIPTPTIMVPPPINSPIEDFITPTETPTDNTGQQEDENQDDNDNQSEERDEKLENELNEEEIATTKLEKLRKNIEQSPKVTKSDKAIISIILDFFSDISNSFSKLFA